ncbi:MAG TPA: Crp/Fnr family transcriptional regulator [Candidatus Binatia bacterium]|nr:Crp/Fnr family transcriptional regulator [Candidatus Binatia bacterium]
MLTQVQTDTRANSQNAILAKLGGGDLALIAPHLQLVDLPRDQRLERRGRACEYVYFIERGLACTIADDIGGHGVEIGMIGREGFVGVSAMLDAAHSAHDVQMLAPGAARRAPAAAVRELLEESSVFRKVIQAYVHRLLLQVMREAQVNARATLEARLARWLLMMHDRVDGDELHLTHDRLATMLGVRRAGVSVAAKKLERGGIIMLHRGSIVVSDRKKLEESSAGTYSAFDKQVCETTM